MTSTKPGDEKAPDNESENSQSDENSSPEEVAAAAIDAAQASAKDEEAGGSDNDEQGAEAGENSEDEAAADPLGFDDARMPETDSESPDLSADAKQAGADGDDSKDGESDEEDAEPDLETQLAAANAKVDDHWSRILRMQADLENERKRTQKQVASAHKFAIEKFAEELLPIKDSLEMGLDAAKADDADLIKIVEGSELTLKLLTQAFEKNQIVEVNPIEEKFDPNVHQAMSMQEVEGKDANTVIGVMQKGYTLNDRLIRPALVTVSK